MKDGKQYIEAMNESICEFVSFIRKPSRVPFSKRSKRFQKYRPKDVPKFVRTHSPCGEYVPYYQQKLRSNRLTTRQRMGWFRWRFVRVIKPGIIDSIVGVQPMSAPAGKIFSLRSTYSNGSVAESG